ncbi:aminotransferase class I/II-fold pyridoxal phosphate-dependent enzyme [Candidatus Poribacteria bacterium]|nr:aminotransferase class I/II-fold pyridoxal phosphate-dependent enzyme [Candidatus Poribacteria bacterium]
MKEKRFWNRKIPLARPWFGQEEPQAAYEVIKSEWVVYGPRTMEFEKRFAEMMGAKHAVAVNSGSSALLVAQAAMGIGPGDEIIVPDMTFITTATSCMFLGAIPVFADIELSFYCIDPDDIERQITNQTKVIIPVHYSGHTADMDIIMNIARRHDLMVLEDAAEAHLSEYNGQKCGTIGDVGIFSFTPSKPMTTGEGGMIVTNNDAIAEKCRLIRNFGDTDKFRWDILGFNFRMPEVMGAIGLIQLGKLEDAVKRRRDIAMRYTEALKDIDEIIVPDIRRIKDTNFQLYTLRLKINENNKTRDQFINDLSELGVSSRLYYPCLHKQGVFEDICNQNDSDFPKAVEFERTAFSIPIYPGMSDDDVEYVIDAVMALC